MKCHQKQLPLKLLCIVMIKLDESSVVRAALVSDHHQCKDLVRHLTILAL